MAGRQTARHWVYGGGTDMVLAQASLSGLQLPEDVRRALESTIPRVRAEAVNRLVALLYDPDPAWRQLARRDLRRIADGPHFDLASTARHALSQPRPGQLRPAPPRRPPDKTFPFSEWIRCVQFSQDDRHLAIAGRDRRVLVVDRKSGQVAHSLDGHTDWVRAVAFHRDGRLLASAGDDTRVLLWDLNSDTYRTLSDHRTAVLSVAIDPDGRVLASAGRDIAIRIRDIGSGEVRHRMTDHRGTFTCVTFRPDGLMLASSSDDGLVRLWNPLTGRVLRTLPGHSGWLNAVAFNPDGTLLASAGENRIIRVWDVNAAGTDPVREIDGHTSPVLALAVGRAVIARAGEDGTIQLDPLHGSTPADRFAAHQGSINSLAMSHDGKMLASGGKDTTVRIWRL